MFAQKSDGESVYGCISNGHNGKATFKAVLEEKENDQLSGLPNNELGTTSAQMNPLSKSVWMAPAA